MEKMFLKLPSAAIFFFFISNKNFSLRMGVLSSLPEAGALR
ncbi:hypothetical protein ACFSQQ_25110 [Mesorhizobium kowhaii]